MSEHSKLSPSSAARRIMCPGSRYMESLYPREQTEQSKEGETAHHFAAIHLKRKIDVQDSKVSRSPDYSQDIPPHMSHNVHMYINHILATRGAYVTAWGYPELHIEERLNMPMIHAECWGTPDAWFVADDTLHMFDFKYGFKPVEAFENWQMIEYAAGVTQEFSKAVFHIVQPRAPHIEGPIRMWQVDLKDLVEYWDMLMRVEYEAAKDNAPQRTSMACINCMARHACATLQKTVLNQIEGIMMFREPNNLTNEQLGNELRLLQDTAMLIDARMTGLEEEALAKLKAGNRIPHYELGEVQSREKWTCDPTELGKLFDVELRKPVEVEFITPKQAIKAGIPAKVVRQYSDTPKGALKLQAIGEKKIRKIFS